MKKLLVLTAVAALTVGTSGCRCCQWLWRGAAYDPAVPMATYGSPAPMCSACDPCASAPAITPGPAPYTSTPAQ